MFNIPNPLAAFDISDNMVAVLVIGIAMLVPIVSVLVRHQQRMAMILRQGVQPQSQDVSKLAAEVERLRTLVEQQTIMLDNLADSQRRIASSLPSTPPPTQTINV